MLIAAMVLKGILVTSQGSTEIGRQSFEDDGKVLRSEISFGGHRFTVAIERGPRRAIVVEGDVHVTRDIPVGAVALENGDWQAYAIAADQYPNAHDPEAVKVLLPGSGAIVDGKIRVRPHPDKSRDVEVAIGRTVVDVDIGPNGGVTHAWVVSQGLDVRPAGAALVRPGSSSRPAVPRGVVEEAVENSRGGVKLRGVLWLPAAFKERLPLALIVGGSGPTDRDGNQAGLKTDCYRMLAEGLAQAGVASIRYDKRGIGASDGISESTLTIEDYVSDAAEWVAFARRDHRFSRVTVIGHSEGGLIALLLAQHVRIDGVVLVATAGRPLWQVLHEQLGRDGAPPLRAEEILVALRDGKPIKAYPPELASLFRPSVEKFLRSEVSLEPVALVAKLTIPVAVVQGETDMQVSVADAKLLAAGRAGIHVTILPKVNHVLKEESVRTLPQSSYVDPSRPLGHGVIDAVLAGIR